jgi:hypothetical protein
MAGGWEEVVAVGGGIRTGAGTDVELDKQYEAGGAAEGKILVGGAAAEQANCTYLADFWRNNDFEFSLKVNAQNGAGHSGLQKS